MPRGRTWTHWADVGGPDWSNEAKPMDAGDGTMSTGPKGMCLHFVLRILLVKQSSKPPRPPEPLAAAALWAGEP